MIKNTAKYLALYSSLFLSVNLVAQEIDSITPSGNKIRIIQAKDIPLDSTVRVQNVIPDSTTILSIGTKDAPGFLVKNGEKFQLPDNPLAAKYDSIWLKEMSDSAHLFDEMYEEVSTITLDENGEDVYASIDTETLKIRLEKLNQKTPFNVEYNASLESVINSYLKRRRGLIERMLTLSQFYFPLFEQELANYNIPLELKYLAVIESALNPKAKSRVGATGLWQFMYPTGKMYDLDVSSYVDERSDPIKSTQAACKYLAKLYGIFEDWDLALAAYNSGPGNVNKAIRRSGGYTNYWNIRKNLPRETAGYVPAFLATMYLFEYAKEHGINPKNAERPYFQTDTILIKKNISFKHVSELVNVSEEELEVLNPSYKLNIIPYVDGEDYALRLPITAIGKFVSNEDAIYAYAEKESKTEEKPLPQFVNTKDQIRYYVKSGDYLGKIAESHGVGVSQLKRWNNLRSNRLKIGQRLLIYGKTRPAVAKNASKSSTNRVIPKGTKIHTVSQGDSLWTISRKYPGLTVDNLKKWNGISGNNLKLGTKLVLCDCQP
ncbi:transglycosylase SLT domain-containing protein [Cellulophaga baltica]|uniref:lytic transglycosylase domain-containing protein n=1 Tax=Cellulophaga TaxID=104264 RepID=UPI001C07E6C4|nr:MULTISPECIES: lytic transglycosylase domain-containing protein [Cellulophaga]MBU2995915.1 transglycosylase SLT domain-containing protein [Cellulophaga baltica]MDO6767310.1 transglycosylase SLT domain-containing protein [Cellulophaga sp. 1_MG-2023]